MASLDDRLTELFSLVFPTLNRSVVRAATRDSLETWDSVATITLGSLVEEEFGTSFDPDKIAEWDSYSSVRAELVVAGHE